MQRFSFVIADFSLKATSLQAELSVLYHLSAFPSIPNLLYSTSRSRS